MPPREWTLIFLSGLCLLLYAARATATSTEDILGLLTNNGSFSRHWENSSTTSTRGVDPVPAATTQATTSPPATMAPARTTPAPVASTQAPTQPVATPPRVTLRPIKALPKATSAAQRPLGTEPNVTAMTNNPCTQVILPPPPLPVHATAKSNHTSPRSTQKQAEPVTMPSTVAKANLSENTTYVWVVAVSGIAMTVASVLYALLTRKLGGKQCLQEPVYQSDNRGTQAMRHDGDPVVSHSRLALSMVPSRPSSKLFVVDEGNEGCYDNGNDDASWSMFAVHEFSIVTGLSSDDWWGGTSPSLFTTRTTQSSTFFIDDIQTNAGSLESRETATTVTTNYWV